MTELSNGVLMLFQIANLLLLIAIIIAVSIIVSRANRRLKARDLQFDLAVGKAIKAKRLERGITEEELADKLNASARKIKKIEEGSPDITFREAYVLSGLLDCSVSDFLNDLSNKEND